MTTTLTQVFYSPKPAIFALWLRVVVYGFFVYKLLSRDFSIFAHTPPGVREMYPAFSTDTGVHHLLGFQPLVDLFTFHWIHHLTGLPDVAALQAVQWLAIGFCLLALVFGRGPGRLFAIGSYVLIAYLWGWVWRTSVDVDAVFMQMQLLLLFCFLTHTEPVLHAPKKVRLLDYKAEYGAVFSLVLIVFCFYYFTSGLNKLVDLPLVDWSKFQIYNLTHHNLALQNTTDYFFWVPTFGPWLMIHPAINYLLVPLVYIIHMLVPLMFFRRQAIPHFMVFYVLFHVISMSVQIFFLGVLILWLTLLPVERFLEPVRVRTPQKWLRTLKVLNLFGLMRVEKGTTLQVTENMAGRTLTGFAAVRRLLWASPVLWPLLPVVYTLFYLPFVHEAVRRFYTGTWVPKASEGLVAKPKKV